MQPNRRPNRRQNNQQGKQPYRRFPQQPDYIEMAKKADGYGILDSTPKGRRIKRIMSRPNYPKFRHFILETQLRELLEDHERENPQPGTVCRGAETKERGGKKIL